MPFLKEECSAFADLAIPQKEWQIETQLLIQSQILQEMLGRLDVVEKQLSPILSTQLTGNINMEDTKKSSEQLCGMAEILYQKNCLIRIAINTLERISDNIEL